MHTTETVIARIDREKSRYLDELKAYLRYPSVSTDSSFAKDVDACADFLIERMKAAGLKTEKILTSGHPLVYAEWMGAPGKPTVLFYGHYDVQPADPVAEWRHPPFEPTEEGDLLVCRGSTDDKGQSYCHLKGVEAILQERGALPVNVKFLVEGEEESGGHAIEVFVKQDAGRKLACDAVVISDNSMYGPGQPSLVYGLRGIAYMEMKVTGANRDLHSGTYGGGVANPLNALCTIIDRLKDPETGKVLIDGFYDDVQPLAEWERAEFKALGFDEEEQRVDLGVDRLVGEEGYTYLERVSARPTCDVNGIYGGYMGKGAKTVLPAWAGAKVSMRLVPDQEPEVAARQFTEYVQRIAPAGVKVEVSYLHGGAPALFAPEGSAADAAMAALEEVWGRRPVRVREGGSIPIATVFARVLDRPVLFLGFGLNDDRLHAPNEKFNLSHYYNGIRSVATFLDRWGGVPAR
jgi:acetylornithine deacetylase/succinyl-diaminopimelate desuccinylase-like protein